MKAVIVFTSLGLAAICPQVASAHHSYASFDMSKSVKLTGVVKEFHWTNPHSFIVLSTTNAAGQLIEVTLETNGPGYLVRQGWKRDSVQSGDKISATVHPMHDGTPGGSLMSVTLPNGKELSAEVTGPRPVEAASPAGENKNDK